jgi:hypothetical protein
LGVVVFTLTRPFVFISLLQLTGGTGEKDARPVSEPVYSTLTTKWNGRTAMLVWTVCLPRPLSDPVWPVHDQLVGRGCLYDMVFLSIRGRMNKFFLYVRHRTSVTRTRSAYHIYAPAAYVVTFAGLYSYVYSNHSPPAALRQGIARM